MPRRTARSAGFALLLALTASLAGPGSAQQGEQVLLDVAAARLLGRQAMAEGRYDILRQVGVGLLARDAADPEAWLFIALSETAAQNERGAVQAARRAYRGAETPVLRFQAARVAALAQTRRDRHVSAEWWLRRAAQAAPDAAARAQAARDFRFVRARNPWDTKIGFSITPTNNINNGTFNDTVELAGLPFVVSPDAQALSGTQISTSVSTRYRLRERPRAATDVTALIYAEGYVLSDETEREAPMVSAGDYSYVALEAGVTHRWVPEGRRLPVSLSFQLGQSWYGGEGYATYGRLTLGQSLPLGAQTTLGGRLSYELQERNATDRTVDIFGVGVQLGHRLAGGDRLLGTLDWRGSDGGTSTTTYDEYRGRVSYRFGAPVQGAQLSLSAGLTWRDFPVSSLDPDGRQDLTSTLTASAVLTQVDYLGFSPTVDLRWRRTGSNIEFYETEELGLTLGFTSTF